MEISRIDRERTRLILRGKVFGAMPLAAVLTPQAAREGLRLLGWRGIIFLITLPLRKSTAPRSKS
jgi:hypothetical protein